MSKKSDRYKVVVAVDSDEVKSLFLRMATSEGEDMPRDICERVHKELAHQHFMFCVAETFAQQYLPTVGVDYNEPDMSHGREIAKKIVADMLNDFKLKYGEVDGNA
ncbi:MAG: hypothetical protein ACNYPH_06360 [Gammaproteobacteria bacterium WSBS_2016_MAG_OTU1]